MPDAQGAFKGISVPAEAWERVFMTPHEEAFAQRLEQYERMVGTGSIDPECKACIEHYGTKDNPTPDAFCPSHKPSLICESGSRPHCTCDCCF